MLPPEQEHYDRHVGNAALVGRSLLYNPLLLRPIAIPWLTSVRIFLIVAFVCAPVSFYFEMPVATALILAYEVGIVNYVVDRQRRELMNLRPILICDEQTFETHLKALTNHPKHLIWIAWLLGPVVTLVVNYNGPTILELRQGGSLTLPMIWGFALTFTVWSLVIQICLVIGRNTLLFARLGANKTRVDLFDTSSLTPYSRVGIRNIVIFAGAYAFFPLALMFGREYLAGVLIAFALTLPVALFLLIAPMYPVKESISRVKSDEQKKIMRALHGDKKALSALAIDCDSNEMNVASLVMYRQMVEGIKEWPVDAPGIVRFCLYVIIPVLAWVGASIVDRLVYKFL